jgi:hypothetical protein
MFFRMMAESRCGSAEVGLFDQDLVGSGEVDSARGEVADVHADGENEDIETGTGGTVQIGRAVIPMNAPSSRNTFADDGVAAG